MKHYLYQGPFGETSYPGALDPKGWAPCKWQASSMREAAAVLAATEGTEEADAVYQRKVVVFIADPDGATHPNGAPRVAHRFDLIFTRNL